MQKKPFFHGILIGVFVSILAVGLLHVTAANIATGKNEMTLENKIGYISEILNRFYVEDVDPAVLEEGIYEGLVSSLGDPYTSYLSKEKAEQFFESTSGAFCGIGVEVYSNPDDNSLTVMAPMAGTPAEKAGIQADDRIIKINESYVNNIGVDEAIQMMKGEQGSKVKITVYRPSENKTIDFELTRDTIPMTSVRSDIVDGDIGYIYISSFKQNTYDQFMQAYQELMAQDIQGLIIDVRNNPGGLFDVVRKIADVLLPEGTIVYTLDKEGKKEVFTSDANCIQIPLCLLVNENSASASEILAGAVQDQGVGKLVGSQTFGKGLVQNVYTIPDGSAVKVTIQKYYTPRGVCIQGTGITPDYVVDFSEDTQGPILLGSEEDIQFQKAVEVIRMETAS